MILTYQQLLPSFSQGSRVWIFQSTQLLSIPQAIQIEDHLEQFLKSWTSHNDKVEGYANLFFGYFLIFIAQEQQTKIGGCSADTLFHFVQQLEQQQNLSFLNRQLQAFVIKDKIQTIPFSQIEYAYKNDFINDDTLYFNNAVHSLKELKTEWIQTVKSSWLRTHHIV